jgi:hypothetical protein
LFGEKAKQNYYKVVFIFRNKTHQQRQQENGQRYKFEIVFSYNRVVPRQEVKEKKKNGPGKMA